MECLFEFFSFIHEKNCPIKPRLNMMFAPCRSSARRYFGDEGQGQVGCLELEERNLCKRCHASIYCESRCFVRHKLQLKGLDHWRRDQAQYFGVTRLVVGELLSLVAEGSQWIARHSLVQHYICRSCRRFH